MPRLSFQTHSFCLFLFLLLTSSGTKLIGDEFQPKEIWRYTIGGNVRDVAYDYEKNRVFCSSFDTEKLYCLNGNGYLIWEYTTNGPIHGVAYDVKNKRVFCGSNDHQLHCLTDKGIPLWTYKAEENVIGIACDFKKQKIFFGSNDTNLYCLNYSGEFLWSYKGKNSIRSVACDSENCRVFCGSTDGCLSCLSFDGKLLWEYQITNWIRSIACDPINKRVFCSSIDKNLYCLNQNGKLIWQYTTDGTVNGVIYDCQDKRIFLASEDNKIYCLDDKGKALWNYHLGSIKWHLNLAIDSKNKIIFIPSNKGIGAIQYREPPVDVDEILEELETCLEKHSAEAIEKLQLVVDMCPEPFPHSICTPISKGFIFSIQEEGIQGKSHHVLYKTDPYMKKEPIKHFPPTFSPIPPLLIDKKDDIYFVSKHGEIFCYTQGQEFVLFDKHKYTSPSIGESGLLYFSSKEGDLFCANPETRGIIWKQKVESKEIWPSPAVDESGNAYFADKSTLYTVSMTGELTQKAIDVPINSPLKIGAKGNLYFLSDPSTLTSIDSSEEFRWSYRIYDFTGVTSPKITSPTFDLDGNVYVGSSNGKIYCIDTETGNWRWQIKVNNNSPISLAPTSNENGEVFFLAEDGAFYRIRKLGFFEKAPFNWLKF